VDSLRNPIQSPSVHSNWSEISSKFQFEALLERIRNLSLRLAEKHCSGNITDFVGASRKFWKSLKKGGWACSFCFALLYRNRKRYASSCCWAAFLSSFSTANESTIHCLKLIENARRLRQNFVNACMHVLRKLGSIDKEAFLLYQSGGFKFLKQSRVTYISCASPGR